MRSKSLPKWRQLYRWFLRSTQIWTIKLKVSTDPDLFKAFLTVTYGLKHINLRFGQWLWMHLLGILYWNKLRNRKRLQFIAYQLIIFMTYNKAIVKIPTHVHHYLVWMMDFVHLSMKMVSNAIVQMVLLVIPVPKSSPQLQGWFSFCAALWSVLLDSL